MDYIISLLYKLGTAVCHQIDERTFHFQGHPLIVCARDTGTYTGFILSLIYWMIINKKIKGGTPPFYALLTASIFIGTLVIDGGTSYLHIRETNNHIRLLTGLLAGSGACILIIPCVFDLLYKYTSPEKFIGKLNHFLIWIVMIIILYFVIITEYYLLYYPLSFLITIGILTLILTVNAVIIFLIPPWNKKTIKDWKSFLIFFIPALFLSCIELYLTYRLHIYVKLLFPYSSPVR
ncbi:MAG TPA: DUF2085 domain-containing protein [Candidatus Eremiobacteraeota bacterium]|nr:MAG: hypothetical protein BWY64_01699 [bacterium ADurb.Bin363]HPZ06781.1 DUF2085 domain-containing protein [Candidatus Eremiobacteraeota bacterium]